MGRQPLFPKIQPLVPVRAIPIAFLILLSLGLYANTLDNDFVFDDKVIIEKNPDLRSIGAVGKLFVSPYWTGEGRANRLYRPVTSVTFAANYLVGGGSRWSFHLTNSLLHGLVAALVYALLSFQFGRRDLAFIAAVLFAVHPLHTEVVAGLVGRAELLAALGLLLGLYADRAIPLSRFPRIAVHLLTLGCLSVALLSKENAMVFPALLVWGDALLGRPEGLSLSRRRLEWVASLLVVLLYLGIRYQVLGSLMETSAISEVDNPLAHTSPSVRFLTAVALTAKYLGLFLLPLHLSADYSAPQILPLEGLWNPALGLGVTVMAGGGFLIALSRRRAGVLAWGLGFAGLSFLLVSNLFFPIGTIFAERLLYLPSVGLCTVVGFAVVNLAQKRSRGVWGLSALILLLLAGRTWIRNDDWQNDFTLFQSASRVSQKSAKVHYNLGNAYRRQGHPDLAAEEYRTALRLYPEFPPAKRNLGVTLTELGQTEAAISTLRKALIESPERASIHTNLGNAYRRAGRWAEAELEYETASELDPLAADPHNNLALLYQDKDPDRAEREFREGVRLEPNRVALRVNLGNFLIQRGKLEEAESVFRAARALDPSRPEPYRGLGEALLGRGDGEQAEKELQTSLELDPDQWEAPALLGYLHQKRGEKALAVRYYQDSLDRNPNQFELHRNLGALYLTPPPDPDRALDHLRKALALKPPAEIAKAIRDLIRQIELDRANR